MFQKHKGGVIPSPQDERDWHIDRIMDFPSGSVSAEDAEPEYPRTYKVSYVPEIMDQGKINNCTAYALSLIFTCIFYKICNRTESFSKGFIYGNRRETEYHGEGCVMRDVVKTAQKYGDTFERIYENLSEMPECEKQFEEQFPLIGGYAKKLIKGYIRLRTEEEAKAFMYRYDLPLFINAQIRYVNPLSRSEEYHAMVAIGYNKKHFINQNSWGWMDCPHPEIKFENYTEVWGIVPNENIEFTDIDIERWSADSIALAVREGIIAGFPDGTFRPEAVLTREQAAAIAARIIRYVDERVTRNGG